MRSIYNLKVPGLRGLGINSLEEFFRFGAIAWFWGTLKLDPTTTAMPCIEAIVTESEPNDDKYKLNPTPDPDSSTGVYIPVDIQDAMRELERMLHPALIEDIKNCENEIDLIGKHHFGLGMWMRNNWGLWQGSCLLQYLNSIGHYYLADDASSFILKCFWQHLNGQPLDLDSR